MQNINLTAKRRTLYDIKNLLSYIKTVKFLFKIFKCSSIEIEKKEKLPQ